MQPSLRALPLVCLLLLLAPSAAPASTRVFFWLEGMPGDAAEPKYKGWFDGESFQLTASRGPATAGGGGGGGAGGVSFSPMLLRRHSDPSSPKLLQACLQARRFPTAHVEVVDLANPATRTRYTLSEVAIDGISQSGTTGSRPDEEVSLGYRSIVMQRFGDAERGTEAGVTGAGWDLQSGRPIAPPPAGEAPSAGEPTRDGTTRQAPASDAPRPAAGRVVVSPAGSGFDDKGRLLAPFPRGVQLNSVTTLEVFRRGEREPVARSAASGYIPLEPGTYDVVVSGRRVEGVELRAGHDTRLSVGVLQLPGTAEDEVEVADPETGETFLNTRGGQPVGLPGGTYTLLVNDRSHRVEVRPGEVTGADPAPAPVEVGGR